MIFAAKQHNIPLQELHKGFCDLVPMPAIVLKLIDGSTDVESWRFNIKLVLSLFRSFIFAFAKLKRYSNL